MLTALALEITVHPTEAVAEHQLQILVQSEDGTRIAELGAAFQLSGEGVHPGELLHAPIAVPLVGVALPVAGGYSIEILIDRVHKQTVSFWAFLAPEENGG